MENGTDVFVHYSKVKEKTYRKDLHESVYCYNLDYKDKDENKLELAIEIPCNIYSHLREE